jgi:leucyl-tRNA synthetase
LAAGADTGGDANSAIAPWPRFPQNPRFMASSRRQYPFHLIEPKWQQFWEEQQAFRAFNPGEEIPKNHPFAQRHGADSMVAGRKAPPKFYILDMFPYPSGAGLHVGHPEGYTATDILARYKRALGFNVLHPMGWDAFGLPAEQYAVKTGQHPRQTTEQNIATFKRQIQSLGFSYDWSRELATTDPDYFKWTQWIFLKLYNSWFNPETNKAEPIETLEYLIKWDESKRRVYRDSKRLAYVAEAPVWWCEQLGTVLANEEVVDGRSEVGGFPVVRKPMRQWMLRITEYAERLLQDLEIIDWSNSLKEMQRNWICRSEGAEVEFKIRGSDRTIKVFTTRPDTLFGATFMAIAPDNKQFDDLIPNKWPEGTPDEWKFAYKNSEVPPALDIKGYRDFVASLSDLQRQMGKSGVFTGIYAINPANQQEIPIFFSEYILASYGTGAIMAVPAHDERDFQFARQYKLRIKSVVARLETSRLRGADPRVTFHVIVLPVDESGKVAYFSDDVCDEGEGYAVNSANSEISLDGLPTPEAKRKITGWLEAKGLGRKTVNYKLRDWLFSRQRYWGEPFPVVWKKGPDGQSYHEALPESALPVLPPELTDYKPTATGEPPLARAKDWVNLPDGSQRETNTMPQWAGSCWYYLRYLDSKNPNAFVGKEAEQYWMGSPASNFQLPTPKSTTPGVDLYVGGTEHAVLHLLYARFWHKVLFDLGHVSTPEPFFKLVNQGLILGEDGQKMSKSRGNVVNPDDVMKDFGTDALRLFEMFMGPLEMVKPWSTKGVEGVYRFLGRVWRLFVDETSETEFEQAETTAEAQRRRELLDLIHLDSAVKDIAATPAQLKTLHACIKKVTEDLDTLRFNTAISALMVFVNEAMSWETKPVTVLRDFLILLQPFAPHLAEELWFKIQSSKFNVTEAGGNKTLNLKPGTLNSLSYQPWPKFDPALLIESEMEIPVQVNGKLRDVIKVPANADNTALEAAAKASEKVQPFLTGKTIKKVIVVPKKLVNLIVS